MSGNLRARTVLIGSVIGLAAGCLISSGDFAGKPCGSDEECPSNYRCAPRDEGSVCELLYPSTRNSGPPEAGPQGPPRYYCSDVRPLLDYYCVDCHGPGRNEGGQFRFDYYERDGGLPGARAKASAIKYRVALARTMPPPDANFFPSDLERMEFFLWVDAGAPFCNTGADGGDGG
jgi:hypothetical protein